MSWEKHTNLKLLPSENHTKKWREYSYTVSTHIWPNQTKNSLYCRGLKKFYSNTFVFSSIDRYYELNLKSEEYILVPNYKNSTVQVLRQRILSTEIPKRISMILFDFL